ncbi:MAG: hypothetical protein M3Q75_02115 [Gemmatimonadota bacterium]|nr:hypothetical protein [Gemmatimonadota bacterium]
MCAFHAEWTAHLSVPGNGQCDNCGGDLYAPNTHLYENNGFHGGTFCQSCMTLGDA